ncbi:MAG: hypothetical protein HY399_03205 [Elusimicrobia bacterium]|nr:hypothetical protein [Elusimicrobiota bacterium]
MIEKEKGYFKRLICLIFLGIALVARELSTETLTMTTYYPAPYGVYNQIITTGQTILARDSGNVGIGDSSPSNKFSVTGRASFTDNVGIGVSASAPGNKLQVISNENSDYTVYGWNQYSGGSTPWTRSGIKGVSYDVAAYGELGRATKSIMGTVTKIGVYGTAPPPGPGPVNYAGYFDGRVKITGRIFFNGQKICMGGRTFSPVYRNDILVSDWTFTTCQNYMTALPGAQYYQLGCVFENDYSIGTQGILPAGTAGVPSPNCGW